MEKAPIFPIVLKPDSHGRLGWRSETGDKVLVAAATHLCSFQKGEMFRSEYYGVSTNKFLEMPNNDVGAFMVYRGVKDSFEEFEPRLTLKDTTITRDGSGGLGVKISLITVTSENEIEIEM